MGLAADVYQSLWTGGSQFLEYIHSVILVFQPSFVTVTVLSPVALPLLSGSRFKSSPLPCVNKCTVYTCTVCEGGGYRDLGRQINTCHKVP